MVAYLFDEQYEKQTISKMQTNFRGGIWIGDKETEYALEGKLPSKTGLHCNRGISNDQFKSEGFSVWSRRLALGPNPKIPHFGN